jgi:hypothetical protein
MTWTIPSGVGDTIGKIAVAGVLVALPATAVCGPAYAAPGFGGTPSVLPAPPPADPPAPPPPPAPAQHSAGEYYNANDANDWNNWYNAGADGGGGGGGGGG